MDPRYRAGFLECRGATGRLRANGILRRNIRLYRAVACNLTGMGPVYSMKAYGS
jgi:hypothetical protein